MSSSASKGLRGPLVGATGPSATRSGASTNSVARSTCNSEREANTFECDGVVCRNPYTGGTYPDPDVQGPVGTTSDRGYSCYQNGCVWPDGTPVIGADRCGMQCGEPPTSGELQTQHGCEAGYIDDPELCAAVGR